MGTAWQDYLEWNDDVALSLYPEISEPRMVFLDLEGDALRRIAERREIPRDEVVPTLVDLVCRTLDPSTKKSAFRYFTRATARWERGDRLAPPPGIGLLALFSLAAERMHHGDGLADHNYYGQLARLLNDQDAEVMSESYRESSTGLWESLTTWLEYNEGRRGTPVTFTVGHHEYIGRAKAQALIRDTDRRRLEAFFTDFDLSPRSEMTPDQLEPLLGAWLNRSTSPRHLASLWEEETLRGPLVEAVKEFLASWDGAVSESDNQGAAATQVRLALARRSGLRKGWTLSLALRLPRSDEGRRATLHAVGGDVEVGLSPTRPGELRITDLKNLLTPEQLVTGRIDLTDTFAGRVSRGPRTTVVLRREEMSADWIEVSQVRLGDQVAILAREDQHLDQVLREVSGTDWTVQRSDETTGLPQGWKLIQGITIVGQPAAEYNQFHDLYALVPITHTAFSPAGGLRLPSGGREWRFHADDAPTITVAHPGARFTAHLLDLDSEVPMPLDAFLSETGEPIVISLPDQKLASGAYGLRVTDGKTVGTQRELWLHDSADPTPTQGGAALAHGTSDYLWAICADSADSTGETVHGLPLFAANHAPGIDMSPPSPTAWWRRDRSYVRGQAISVAVPGPDSCVYTGKHHEQVETAMPNHQGYYRGTSLGVCAECGRTKRYSNSYWKNNRRWERAQRELGPAAVAPTRRRVTALGTDLDWNLLLDSLVTTSAGSANDLRRLTQQFDPSARFFHEVVTTLSDLGHIEVARDPATAEMTHWETAPTGVIGVDGEWVLVGHWPRDYVADLEEHGAQVRRESQEGAPDRVTTTASRELIAEVIPEALISEDAAIALAGALPTLSAVIEALPRVPMPGVVTLDRYEPARDVWQTVTSAQVPGSYRTGGYSRTYVVRTAQDVADGTARVVTVGLAKHAVAIAQSGSRPLLAYDPARKTLTVPLGARLPEMYSRAATLASGRAPQRWDDGEYGSFMAYRDVPEGVARLIHHAMGA